MKKMRIVQLSNGQYTAQFYDENIFNWNWAIYRDGKIHDFSSVEDVKKEVIIIANQTSGQDVFVHRVIEEVEL